MSNKTKSFKPNKRSITDGPPRRLSNGDNANQAASMLALLPDAEHLAPQELVVDALTNLMHYCHREGIDFAEAVDSARTNWEAER